VGWLREGPGGGTGGEMTQTMYVHMNTIKKKKRAWCPLAMAAAITTPSQEGVSLSSRELLPSSAFSFYLGAWLTVHIQGGS
jgi:hypothetical protein